MRLYLDDDTAFPLLARLLRQAGHDVELPADAGLAMRMARIQGVSKISCQSVAVTA